MAWKLWLDDQLDDPDCPLRHTPEGFLGAKSTFDAINLIKEHGLPSFYDFDHDLGFSCDDVKNFLWWLSQEHPDNPPENYNVHSANPLAKAWIDSYISSWRKSLELESSLEKLEYE